MVDAVLLVLREVLEAALIICLLLSLSHKLAFNRIWIVIALVFGFAGSWVMAHYTYAITEALDGMGQELLNSALYAITIICVLILALLIAPLLFISNQLTLNADSFLPAQTLINCHRLIYSLCIMTVSLSIVREGSEVWIYLSGFTHQPGLLSSALIGSAIGVGIGASLGAITYYLFIFMPRDFFLPVFLIVMTLLAGGLSMQIAEQLMQIGILESTAPLWDSSFIVNEQSWLGELLYALLGYDAKPTFTQGVFYLAAIAPVVAGVAWYFYRSRISRHE